MRKNLIILTVFLFLSGSSAQAGRPVNRSPAISPAPSPSLTPEESGELNSSGLRVKSLQQKRADRVLKLRKLTPGSEDPKKVSDDELIQQLPDPIGKNYGFFDQNRVEANHQREKIRSIDQEILKENGRSEINARGHGISDAARQQIEFNEKKKKSYEAEIESKARSGQSTRELNRLMKELAAEQKRLLAGKVTDAEVKLDQVVEHVNQLLKMPAPQAPASDSTAVTGTQSKDVNEAPSDSTSRTSAPASTAQGISHK